MFWEVVNLHLAIWQNTLTKSSEIVNFQSHWSCLTSYQFMRKMNPQINLIFDQLAFCLLFPRFLKKLCLINYATIRTSFRIAYFADFERLILHNMPYLRYSRPGKKSSTNVGLLELYLWIYLKHMTAYLMIYW